MRRKIPSNPSLQRLGQWLGTRFLMMAKAHYANVLRCVIYCPGMPCALMYLRDCSSVRIMSSVYKIWKQADFNYNITVRKYYFYYQLKHTILYSPNHIGSCTFSNVFTSKFYKRGNSFRQMHISVRSWIHYINSMWEIHIGYHLNIQK